jgi:hypothetical protein
MATRHRSRQLLKVFHQRLHRRMLVMQEPLKLVNMSLLMLKLPI